MACTGRFLSLQQGRRVAASCTPAGGHQIHVLPYIYDISKMRPERCGIDNKSLPIAQNRPIIYYCALSQARKRGTVSGKKTGNTR